MDWRRLESAHLRYAVLKTQSYLPKCVCWLCCYAHWLHKDLVRIYSNVLQNLYLEIFRFDPLTCVHIHALLCHFSPKLTHTLERRCKFPGCKNVLVLDKNMKNQCLTKKAGYITYPGLPGRIKTGCMASPAFKLWFCTHHKIRSCKLTEGGTL